MQTNEINSPEIKNHKKKEWSSLKLAGAVLRIDRGLMTIPIRHGVGDWPFHWPGWSIRSSRSGLHGRSLVSYGNVDYHLGRSRSGGLAASGYYLCPGSASVTWVPPHLTHGPMNRRCRSSGDVARELVDRLPTPPRQGRYTVLVTSPLVSGVAAILWQGLGQKHEHGSAMQCNHTCRVYSSLFLYSSRLWHIFCRLSLYPFRQLNLQMVQCLWGSAGVWRWQGLFFSPIWKPCAGTEEPCCVGDFLCCDSPFLFLVTFIYLFFIFYIFLFFYERTYVVPCAAMLKQE